MTAVHIPPDPPIAGDANDVGGLDAGQPQISPDWWIPGTVAQSEQPANPQRSRAAA